MIQGYGKTVASGDIMRVAITQAEPEWLNLQATIEKTSTLIAEAAENGAKLVSFLECWVAGYSAWIW